MTIALRLLDRDNPADVRALQAVCEAAPGYHILTGGRPAASDEAHGALRSLPPATGCERKFTYGIELGGRLIGCLDSVRGYPAPEKAMIGLLLLAEEEQGRGYGRAALDAFRRELGAWPEVSVIRIAVVGTNQAVLPFWEAQGFRDTGERRPYENGSVHSRSIVLEMPVTPGRSR